MKKSRLVALAAGIGISISTINVAQASFVLTIDDLSTGFIDVIVSDGQGVGFATDGGLMTTVADTALGADGAISFNSGIGSFIVNVVTGVSDPLIGPGQLDLNSINVSGGSGTLRIGLTDTGYLGAVPAYTANFGGTTSTTGSSVDFDFLHGPSNAEFGGASFLNPLPVSGGAFSGSGTSGIIANSPYSLTIYADVIHTAGGQISSFDAHLVPVPVPPAVWLFGSGLLGLVGIARRKKA
jgi:hypothetical protein